jgi:hypothetical protein
MNSKNAAENLRSGLLPLPIYSIFTLRLNQTQGIFYLASKLSSEIEKIKSIFESSA